MKCCICHKPCPEGVNADLHDWTPNDPEPEDAWIFSFFDESAEEFVEDAVCLDCVKAHLEFEFSGDYYSLPAAKRHLSGHADAPTIVEG